MSRQNRLFILSSMLALSNMGQPQRPDDEIQRLKSCETLSLRSAVCSICEQHMETNEHEDIFVAEARMWYKKINKITDGDFAKNYPHINAQYERAA